MKKFFFLLAVILFIPFRVNALTDPVYFQSPIPAYVSISFNDYVWSTTTFQTVTANSTFNFDLYGSFSTGMQYDSVYVRVSYCVDGSYSKGYSIDPYTIDIDTIRTSIPCEYYGSNYSNGRVAFTTWRFNTAGNASFSTRISFSNGSSNISLGLLGVDLSLSQFPLYSETDAILKSNDSLNNRLQTIINQNNSLAYKIDDTNTLLQQFIESQIVCTTRTLTSKDIISYGYLDSSGNIQSSQTYGITDYWEVVGSITKIGNSGTAPSICFYNSNKVLISCLSNGSTSPGTINIPFGTKYLRASIHEPNNSPQYKFSTCQNGNQAIAEQQQQSNQIQQERNDFLNDDNVDESSSTANSFFSGFTSNDHGLTGIITAPLTLIESLTSKTCSPLVVPLPFVNSNLTLPCMSSIYSQYFGSFYTMYQVITFGIVSYWVLVRIFALVKDFKNPEHDELEVMDL